MSPDELQQQVEALAADGSASREQALPLVDRLLAGLESGAIRAAEPHGEGWRVNGWIKQGILLGFRFGENVAGSFGDTFHFRDKDTFPTWNPAGSGRNVRIVPGGSTVRRGSYLGDGVVVMPPAYVNVGAYVGSGSMIDSHALVGSCAQVGSRVHLSAAAQIGGVLEPIGAQPVIVGDGVFIGGGCGIYEGTRVSDGAVLASGVVLTRSVPIYDLVEEKVHRAGDDGILVVPPQAVLVPGTRPSEHPFARRHGIRLQAPVIVKYRDPSTDAASTLEDALR